MAYTPYQPMAAYQPVYNPAPPYQQRLDQLQQYGQQFQQQPVQQSPMAVKGWPVGCEDDARKAMIDLDGSVFVFPDLQNGRIYTKQISTVDFAPVFKVYKLAEAPQAAEKPAVDLSAYVPRNEFDSLSATVQSLQEVIQQMAANSQTGRRNGKDGEQK